MMKDDAVDDIPTPSVFQAVVGVPFAVGITATLFLTSLLLPAFSACIAGVPVVECVNAVASIQRCFRLPCLCCWHPSCYSSLVLLT
jgi:hypothetical protein